MSDSYQAIYDAVRSRLGGGNIGEAMQSAIRDANLSFYADQIRQAGQQAFAVMEAPSAVFRPKLTIDGDHWCALYGEDLQSGVAGFGKSPAEAMYAFDQAWYKKLEPRS